ncbi:MAG: homoserine dehydrogenase [Candidatus Limnocylindrales bacterium]
MSRQPLRVAVLGAGSVGREVVRAFLQWPERLASDDGRPLVLAGVAVRDVARARARGIPADLLTDAPAHLVADRATDVIVELLGGDEPARTLVAAGLGAGKPVVTANKHVVARHGPQLEAVARQAGTPLRFEAAVAGGIPILGPLAADLAANEVRRVRGIVNGSTNFVLTAMTRGGRQYEDVVAEARAAGYLEADPRADVEGHDAADKLVILARLAFGRWLTPESIARSPAGLDGPGRPGISGVSADDIAAAQAFGLVLKLVATTERLLDGSITAAVLPTALPVASPLGRTDGVLNRVEVEADPVGTVAFEGPGAGGGATSSAVLADLRAIAREAGATWAGLPAAPATAESACPAAEPSGGWLAFVVAGEPDPTGATGVLASRALADGTALRLSGDLASARVAVRSFLAADHARAAMAPVPTLYPVVGD